MTQVARSLENIEWILPWLQSSKQVQYQAIAECTSNAQFVQIDDHERLQQAIQTCNRAKQRFEEIGLNENNEYAESIIEQLQSAEMFLNSTIKELKSKTKYKN
jgi:hypothetical protein